MQTSTSRSWWLAILVLGACAPPGSLIFKRTADGATVNKNGVLNGRVWVPAEADLSSARNTCIDELSAEFLAAPLAGTRISFAPRTELDIYARDPNAMQSFLAGLDSGAIERGLPPAGPSGYSTQVWNAQSAAPNGFPATVALGWPVSNNDPATSKLSTPLFWGDHIGSGDLGDAVCHPGGDDATLQPGGSLKRAVVYNRGACQRELPLGPILVKGNGDLVSALLTQRQPGIGSVIVDYSILQSSLRLGAGVLDDPIPGLYLLLKYDARDLLGNDPSLVWGTVRYDIVLSAGGAIELEPHETAWHFTGGLGPASSEGSAMIPGWHGALTQSQGLGVEALNRKLHEQQLLGVRVPTFGNLLTAGKYACDAGTFAAQCGLAADAVGQTVGDLIRGGKRFSDSELSHMLCSLGHAASCAALGINPSGVVKQRWVCDKSSISETAYCDMIIPVERLTAFPDAVGTVFFDGDDFDNAAYTVQALAQATPTQQPLCDTSNAVPASRSFVSNVLRDKRLP